MADEARMPTSMRHVAEAVEAMRSYEATKASQIL